MTDLLLGRSKKWVKYGMTAVDFATVRDTLVSGTYKPDASTTGVLPGSTLSVVTSAAGMPGGSVAAGMTYSNLDLRFTVTPPTSTTKVVFKNCTFRGPTTTPTSDNALLKLWNAAHAPVECWDCTFISQTPSVFINAVMGYNFALYRCDISGVIDGVDVFNTSAPGTAINARIQQCYIHDLLWFPPGTPGESHSDGSHSDCIQVGDGAGLVVTGNNLAGFLHPDYFNSYYGITQANAAMMVVPDVGAITGMDARNNWLSGGRVATVNFSHNAGGLNLGNVGTFHSNVFTRDSAALVSGDRREIIRPTTNQPTIDFGTGTTRPTANVYEDTNTGPVTVSNG